MLKKILSILLIVSIVCLFTVPVFAEAEPSVGADAAVLMDYATGKILYEKNADKPLGLASVTKIMTLLLCMEAIEEGKIGLNDTVVCSENAKTTGGTTIFLDTNEKISLEKLIRGIIIASANDAAIAVAEYVGGSVGGFVTMMNDKAKELGMENTTFKNPHGLPAEGHVSSARDVAIMSKALLKYQDHILPISQVIWEDLEHEDGRKTLLANTNKSLLTTYKSADGLKTGFTDEAKYCLSATAEKEGLRLIATVLKAPDKKTRINDVMNLFDYGFGKYTISNVVKKGDIVLWDVPVLKGSSETVNLVAESDFSILSLRTEGSDVTQAVLVEGEIKAPIEEGDVLGKIIFYENQKEVGEVKLTADRTVEKMGFTNVIQKIIQHLFSIRHVSDPTFE